MARHFHVDSPGLYSAEFRTLREALAKAAELTGHEAVFVRDAAESVVAEYRAASACLCEAGAIRSEVPSDE